MKKQALLLCFLSLCFWASAQDFEGKIVYQNVYKSNLPNVSDAQFTDMLGSRQDYFIKGGDYKATTNGTFLQWMLYNNTDQKVYTKMANSEAVYWNDATVNLDPVVKAEINKDKLEILGYLCDELVLTCQNSVQRYYYNAKFGLDPTLFAKHAFANWYDFVSKSKALPLKMEIENQQLRLVSTAVEVTPMTLDKSSFALPPNTKTEKNPYRSGGTAERGM